MKYVYPCILTPLEGGGYSVKFPDIAGGTQGKTLYEALEMAEDAAGFMVTTAPDDGEKIPVPTPLDKLKIPKGAFATLIKVDTEAYRLKMNASDGNVDVQALSSKVDKICSALNNAGIKI